MDSTSPKLQDTAKCQRVDAWPSWRGSMLLCWGSFSEWNSRIYFFEIVDYCFKSHNYLVSVIGVFSMWSEKIYAVDIQLSERSFSILFHERDVRFDTEWNLWDEKRESRRQPWTYARFPKNRSFFALRWLEADPRLMAIAKLKCLCHEIFDTCSIFCWWIKFLFENLSREHQKWRTGSQGISRLNVITKKRSSNGELYACSFSLLWLIYDRSINNNQSISIWINIQTASINFRSASLGLCQSSIVERKIRSRATKYISYHRIVSTRVTQN